jgi:hypothetical protein
MVEPQNNPAPRFEPEDSPHDWSRPSTRTIPLGNRIVAAAFLAFGIVSTTFAFVSLAIGEGRFAATLAVFSVASYAAGWLIQTWRGD